MLTASPALRETSAPPRGSQWLVSQQKQQKAHLEHFPPPIVYM